MKEYRNPSTVHAPLAGYTHQIEITGQERILMLSGQVGMDLPGNVPDKPAEQLALALDNLILNLQAAEMETQDIVKLTIYLVTPIDREIRAEIMDEKLKGYHPCMTLIYVAGLAAPNLKVEIDAWASKSIQPQV